MEKTNKLQLLQQSSTTQQTAPLKECSTVDYKDKLKIIVTTPVEKKIRYLCNQLPTLEWSGVLFFTYSGTFEDKNLTIECKDIYVMDIGSAGATEFNMDETVAAYMAANPHLLSCQMGLIHSHNTMATFFSGTDLDTLRKEGMDRNCFVSLIVNNAGSYTAGITRKLTYVSPSASYEFFGEGKKETAISKTTEEIEWFHLQVIKETDDFSFPELSQRLEEIKKDKQQTSFRQPSFSWKPGEIWWKDKKDTAKTAKKQNTAAIDEKEWQKMINHTVNKLVTACPVMSNQKLDIRKWVANSMVAIYRQTFGPYTYEKDTNPNSPLQQWYDNYVDFILRTTADATLSQADYNQQIADIALDIVTILEDLPQNDYMKLLIDTLKDWYDIEEDIVDVNTVNYRKFDF